MITILKYVLQLLFLLTSFLLVCPSCQPEADFSKYSSVPLVLTYEDVSSGIKLRWNKVNASDFVQYFVFRSTVDTIPDIKTNTLPSSLTFFARITDPNKTEFIDNTTLTTKAYYRVFVQLGNRFLGSLNISPNTNITSAAGYFNEFLYNPKRNFVYMYNRDNGLISILDVNKNQVIKTIQHNNSIVFNGFYMNLGQFNGVDELQLQGVNANQNTTIDVFDPVTLGLNEQIPTSLSSAYMYSYCSDDAGLLYAFSASDFSIRAISRAQKTTLTSHYLANNNYLLRFKQLADSKIIGMPNQTGLAELLQFDRVGQLVSPILKFNILLISQSNYMPFTVSPFKNVFVYGNNGLFYDKDIKLLGQLSNLQTYSDFAFSDDANKIFAATNSGSGRRQIDVFSNPSLIQNKSIGSKTFCRNIFYIGNNQVLLVGDGFDILTKNPTTVFEKVDIN